MEELIFDDFNVDDSRFNPKSEISTGYKLVKTFMGHERMKQYQYNPIIKREDIPFAELPAKSQQYGIITETPQFGNKRKREQYLRHGIKLSQYKTSMFKALSTYALARPKEERCIVTLDLDIKRYCDVSNSKIRCQVALVPEFLEYNYQVEMPNDPWLKDWSTLSGGHAIPHFDKRNFGVLYRLLKGSSISYVHPVLLGYTTVSPHIYMRLIKESAPVLFAEDVSDFDKEQFEYYKQILQKPHYQEYKRLVLEKALRLIQRIEPDTNKAIEFLAYSNFLGSKDENGIYLENYAIDRDIDRFELDSDGNPVFGLCSPAFVWERKRYEKKRINAKKIIPRPIPNYIMPNISKQWYGLCNEVSLVNGEVSSIPEICYPEGFEPEPHDKTSVGRYFLYGFANIISGILPDLYNFVRVNKYQQNQVNGMTFKGTVDILSEDSFFKGSVVDSNGKEVLINIVPSLEHSNTIFLCKEEVELQKEAKEAMGTKYISNSEQKLKVVPSSQDNVKSLTFIKEIETKVRPLLDYISLNHKNYVTEIQVMPKVGIPATNVPKTFLEQKLIPKYATVLIDVNEDSGKRTRYLIDVELASNPELYHLPKVLKSVFGSGEVIRCFEAGYLHKLKTEISATYANNRMSNVSNLAVEFLNDALCNYPNDVAKMNLIDADRLHGKECVDVWKLLLTSLGFQTFDWEVDSKKVEYKHYSKYVCDLIIGAFFTGLLRLYLRGL